MRKLEKYTGKKTYMFPTGRLATPEVIAAEYPATAAFVHVVETDANGEVMFALMNLSALRTQYDIDTGLTEADAIAAIEEALNAKDEVVVSDEPTAEERIAAALEAQVMLSMPDVESGV